MQILPNRIGNTLELVFWFQTKIGKNFKLSISNIGLTKKREGEFEAWTTGFPIFSDAAVSINDVAWRFTEYMKKSTTWRGFMFEYFLARTTIIKFPLKFVVVLYNKFANTSHSLFPFEFLLRISRILPLEYSAVLRFMVS